MSRTLRVFFDFGHRWPLWESGTDEYAMAPSDYGFSPELTDLLRRWHAAWERVADFEIGQTDEPPSAEDRATLATLRERGLAGIRAELPAGVEVRVEP
ncbi:MAG: hypothetical protein ACTHJL_00305 [Amnibacterium sp.]